MGAVHSVQLFDSDASLATALARFIQTGLAEGENVLIVTTPQRWAAITTNLADDGVFTRRHIQAKRLTFVDGLDLLSCFMGPRGPMAARFDTSVGHVVRALAADRPLRIFGDMVDVLAAQGDYAGAERVEVLWNELGASISFTLFCGYSATNFGHPRHAGALRQIVRTHSDVRSNPDDILGSFLLDASGALPRA